jgi:hypothetical protein
MIRGIRTRGCKLVRGYISLEPKNSSGPVGEPFFAHSQFRESDMARPRLPAEVATVTGADKRSPGRFEGRSAPVVKSLGPAPKRFLPEQIVIWESFNEDFPWLGRSDRRVVELAVRLQFMIEILAECPVSVFVQMRMCLSSMGGTPADRSKVGAKEEDEEDPADEFLN